MPTSVCMYTHKRLFFVGTNFLKSDSSTGFPYLEHCSKSLYCLNQVLSRRRSYYSFAARFCAATIWGWHLFLWKTQRHQQQLDIRWHSTHSLSVMLSAIELSRTTQTTLVLAWSPSSAIIRTHMHVSHILATATIQGQHLFSSVFSIMRLLFEGGDYLSTASIRRNMVFSCACSEFCLYVTYVVIVKHIMYAHLITWHTRWYRMVFSLWMYLALCASALVSKEARPPRM